MKRLLYLLLTILVLASPAHAAFRGANGPIVTQAGEKLWLYQPDGTPVRSFKLRGAQMPELAPDSRWVVFSRQGDIAKVRVDGTGYRWLTNDAETQSEPTWSPDGHHILYRDEDLLYVMRADGSNVRSLNAEGTDPAWSPDGTRIAYVACVVSCNDVYVMNSDGSEQEAVAPTPDRYEVSVDWSPDSTRLVSQCAPRETNAMLGPESSEEVCIFDLAGGEPSVIYGGDLRALAPTWAPSGRKIAFAAKPPGEEDQEIFTIRPDGTELTRLTYNNHHDRFPDWGPR